MFEIKILLIKQEVEQLCNELQLLDALAITMNDDGGQAIYEPKPDEVIMWEQVTITSLFADYSGAKAAKQWLEDKKNRGCITEYKVQALQDKNWVKESLKQFSPQLFGRRLWICPSWESPPDAKACNVLLDPGLAFGTGTHATTALCLEWIDKYIQGGENVIDYGCGSGILVLAALKLGAISATAIDYDPQALDACRSNALLNGFDNELQICLPENDPNNSADILIANILAAPLIEKAQQFAERVKPEGFIVLSGILLEQAAQVAEAYAPYFAMNEPIIRDEWVLLSGKRL